MKRRLFIERSAALISFGLAAPAARAESGHIRRVELQRSPLAGFQYHQGEEVWPLLAPGASLDLIREPDNRHDARAVRVDWQGHKLGYLPRIDNAAISHLLDNKQLVAAKIIALNTSDNPWERIAIGLTLVC